MCSTLSSKLTKCQLIKNKQSHKDLQRRMTFGQWRRKKKKKSIKEAGLVLKGAKSSKKLHFINTSKSGSLFIYSAHTPANLPGPGHGLIPRGLPRLLVWGGLSSKLNSSFKASSVSEKFLSCLLYTSPSPRD